MSKGMQQRLGIAQALVGRPRLLLLDEPTTGLDPRSRIELWDAIRTLVEAGTDVLLTTQYLDEADQLASQVVIIDHGRTIAAGTPVELKRRIGGNVIEVHTHRRDQLATIAEALGRLEQGRAEIDEATRRVTVGIDDGGDGLLAALRSVEATGVEIADIALRQPTLDEVFLALTGHLATDDDTRQTSQTRAAAA
jgi:ABC-2 type transport system ATP-binding protein